MMAGAALCHLTLLWDTFDSTKPSSPPLLMSAHSYLPAAMQLLHFRFFAGFSNWLALQFDKFTETPHVEPQPT